MSRDAAAVMIYIDDPDDLNHYLDFFRHAGWREIDYCELRNSDQPRDRITYGPCERLRDGG